MVNTHEKLLSEIIINTHNLFDFLQSRGYKGTEDMMIVDLLLAIKETTALLYDETLTDGNIRTQDDYFKILIDEMNVNW